MFLDLLIDSFLVEYSLRKELYQMRGLHRKREYGPRTRSFTPVGYEKGNRKREYGSRTRSFTPVGYEKGKKKRRWL